ncbi:MAG: hypothetical protein ABI131_05170, partial [Nostocoides sp.]
MSHLPNRRSTLAAAAAAVGTFALVAATAATASAGPGVNPYDAAIGHAYRHGAVPTRELNTQAQRWANAQKSRPQPGSAKMLSYGGGVDGIGVTHGTPRVYLVFYGSQWGSQGTDSSGNDTFSGDPKKGAPILQNLMRGLGTGGEQWSGTMTQYCDGGGMLKGATKCSATAAHVGYPTGGALASVWYDNSAASPSNATATQLGQEAVKAAAHFGNTALGSNRLTQYVILSPTGTHPDGFNTSSG